MQSAQESDLAALFGDVSRSEKLSEIKPSLESWSLFLSVYVVRSDTMLKKST